MTAPGAAPAEVMPAGPPEDRHSHPWLGLASYTSADAASFRGRDGEIAELVRLVKGEGLTVVFGQSGTGKTSLLQAGLVPRLEADFLLPVTVRLQFPPEEGRHAKTIRRLLKEQLQRRGIEELEVVPPQRDAASESLWEYFHRHEFWDRKNNLISPVLILDQFEEVFTLGEGEAATLAFLDELADLAEGHVPRALTEELDRRGERLRIPYDTQPYRIVLSIREDFVPRLDELRAKMPVVMRRRFRLRPMTGEQALSAVLDPGSHLIGEPEARALVRFVSSRGPRGPVAEREELSALRVEPALLSVVCRALNDQRLAEGAPSITLARIESAQRGILEDFYDKSFAGLPAARVFVEDRLLTSSGFRSTVPEEEALRGGVTRQDIRTLVDRRVLRVEERLGTPHLELTHDVLTGVARDSRDRRQAREERERLEAGRRKQRRRIQILAVWLSVTTLAAGVALRESVLARRALARAEVSARAERESAQRALASERQQREAQRQALAAGAAAAAEARRKEAAQAEAEHEEQFTRDLLDLTDPRQAIPGSQTLQLEMARKALQHAQGVGHGDELERELALEIGQYRTAVLTAEVQSRRKGITQMQTAIRGLERLRGRYPHEPRIAAAIARSHLAMARIYRDTSETLAPGREAKAGLETVRSAHLEEGEPALTAELLVEHALWLPADRTAEALGLMKEAEAIQRKRVAKDASRDTELGLANALHSRGGLLLARGKPHQAMSLFDDALQLLDPARGGGAGAAGPHDARGADESAFFRARVRQFRARAEGQLGKPVAARADFALAAEQLGQVVGRNPDVARYRLRLAMIHDDLGAAFRGAGILLMAETTYRKSIGDWGELLRRDVTDIDYQKGLLDALLALSDVFIDMGNRPDEAAELLGRARPLARRLAAQSPRDADQQYDLARLLSDVGLLRERRQEGPAALSEYAAAVSAMDRVLELAPGDGYFEDVRDGVLTRAAACAARLGRFTEAVGYLERAVASREKAAKAGGGDRLHVGQELDRRLALARAYRDAGALAEAEREADRVLDATGTFLQRRDYDFAMRRRSVEGAELRADVLEKEGRTKDARNAWLATLVELGAEHGVDLLAGVAEDPNGWTAASFKAARARVPAEWKRFSMVCDGPASQTIDLYLSNAIPTAATPPEARMRPLLNQVRLAQEDEKCTVKVELIPALEKLNALAVELRTPFGDLVDLALNGVWLEPLPLIKQVAVVERSCAEQSGEERRRQVTTFERILKTQHDVNPDALGVAARELLRAAMWSCAGETATAQKLLTRVRDRVEELSRLAPDKAETQMVAGTMYRLLGRVELEVDGDWRKAYGLLQLHEQMACALLQTDGASVANQGLMQAAPLVSKLRRSHGLADVPLCAAEVGTPGEAHALAEPRP